MKRFKIVGLCLMAVFALGAVVASSASAALEPGFTGPFPNHFTSLSLTESTLKTSSTTIKCAHLDNLGEITGAAMGWVNVTFLGCKFSETFPCNSTGAASEEIKTSALLMTPGYIKKGAPTEVGVALEPLAGTAGTLAEFTCHVKIEEKPETKLLAEVKGSVIGKISPPNTKTLEFELAFSESAGGTQSVEKFEGEKKGDHLLEVFLNGETKAVKGVEITNDMIFTEKDTEMMA